MVKWVQLRHPLGCYVLLSVTRNSSIVENKIHTEAVCVCVLLLPTLWGPNVHTSIVIPVNSPYWNILGPMMKQAYKSYRMTENVKMQKDPSDV